MLDNALSGSSVSDCPYSLNPSLYLWDKPHRTRNVQKQHGDGLKIHQLGEKPIIMHQVKWLRFTCMSERERGERERGVMMGPRRQQTACSSLFPLIFIIIRHPGCCSCANIVGMGPTSVCEGSGRARWVVGRWVGDFITP